MHASLSKKVPGPLEQKMQTKLAMQMECGWPKEPKVPLLCLPLGMTDALGGELMKAALPGILSQNIQLLILGKGTADYGALFTKLTNEESHRVHIVPHDETGIRKMMAASDMAIFFGDPTREDILQCLTHAVIPVSLPQTILEDYNPVEESGNSFIYTKENPWLCFAAIVRAVETFKFPYDWKTIQKHCLKDEHEDEDE
ncbi:MAG: starch synthase [Candidatus Peribacteria bacterium]|nr:starch synthase [Candidatus Peribacteria bacterium]